MCADEDEAVRHKAVGMIRKLREKQQVGCELEDEEATESKDEENVDEDLLIYTDDEEDDDGSEDEDYGEEIEMDRSIREVCLLQLK